MKNNKYTNFISSVIYIDNATKNIERMVAIDEVLTNTFEQSQIIVVNNNLTSDKINKILQICAKMNSHIKIVHLGSDHKNDMAMKAGLDICIGDMVFEFDTLDVNYDLSYIEKLYLEAVENNVNLVSLQIKSNSLLKSHIYKIIQKETRTKNLGSEVLRIISRKLINKVHDKHFVNRKVIYRASGLNHKEFKLDIKAKTNTTERFGLLFETLFSYSNFLVKLMSTITITFFALTLIALSYSIFEFTTNSNILNG